MNHDSVDEDTPQPATKAHAHGHDLTVGSVPRLLLRFSLPMLAGSLIQTLYSMVNAFWVGKYLGKEALAAVSVTFPIFFVLVALAMGLTMASSILVSQYAGAKNWVQVRRVVQCSTALMIAVSVVFLLLGMVATVPVLRLMQTPEGVMPLAVPYLYLLLLTIPTNFLLFLASSTLRGVGDSTTPLYFQGVFLVITAILDPMLMFGWLGLPALGLNGTAVATIITMSAATASLYVYLRRKDHIIAPHWRHLRIDAVTSRLLVRIGMPTALQQALVSVGMVFIVTFINHFGDDATAAFGAAMRIDQFAFLPAMTVSMAVSSLAGQNIGARRYARVHQVFWWGIAMSVGITAVISLLAVLFPHFLMGIFINSAREPQVMEIGMGYLRIVGAGYLLFAIMFVSNGIINGAGHTIFTTLVSLIAVWAVRVPVAALLTLVPVRDGSWVFTVWQHVIVIPVPAWVVPHLNRVESIWYAMVLGFAVSMLVSLTYYFSGHWKRAVIKTPLPEIESAQPA